MHGLRIPKSADSPISFLDTPEAQKSSRYGAEYKRRYRHHKRFAGLPADMRCPSCGSVVANSRRWVVKKALAICECLSCWRKRSPSRRKKRS